MENDLVLHNIKAPELNSVEYGKDIKEQFDFIDRNFKMLSNYDFIKGEKGDSVFLKKEILPPYDPDLIDTDEYYWEKILMNTIKNHQPFSEGLDPITNIEGKKIEWFDNFIKNPGHLLLLCQNNKVISSLPYFYIDPRFTGNVMERTVYDDSNYIGKVDCSSNIYFDKYINDEPVFKIADTFPTLYYDDNSNNFCWKLWGEKTGLIANGPAGKDAGTSGVYATVIKWVPKVNI